MVHVGQRKPLRQGREESREDTAHTCLVFTSSSMALP